MEGYGTVDARDVSQYKVDLIEDNIQRTGSINVQAKVQDATVFDVESECRADIVLADVPCSGYGVIGKKPEIRNKSRHSLQEFPTIQRAILLNLADFVRPGGTLLYSTCTILEEENEQVVRTFLSERDDYMLEGFHAAGIECPDGMYTFWPNIDGTDGFFAARLKRKS